MDTTERRMTVATRMDADPPVASLGDRITDAAATMRRHGTDVVIVVDNPRSRIVQGLLTSREIVFEHVAGAHPRECRVREHAARLVPTTVAPDVDFDAACTLMRAEGVTGLPVVGGGGRLLGRLMLPTSDHRLAHAGEAPR